MYGAMRFIAVVGVLFLARESLAEKVIGDTGQVCGLSDVYNGVEYSFPASCSQLNLRKVNLDASELTALLSGLTAVKTPVTALNLKDNTLGDSGALVLANFLASPAGALLEIIDVRNNKMTAIGLLYLAEVLAAKPNNHPPPVRINVDGNYISLSVVKQFSKLPLVQVDVIRDVGGGAGVGSSYCGAVPKSSDAWSLSVVVRDVVCSYSLTSSVYSARDAFLHSVVEWMAARNASTSNSKEHNPATSGKPDSGGGYQALLLVVVASLQILILLKKTTYASVSSTAASTASDPTAGLSSRGNCEVVNANADHPTNQSGIGFTTADTSQPCRSCGRFSCVCPLSTTSGSGGGSTTPNMASGGSRAAGVRGGNGVSPRVGSTGCCNANCPCGSECKCGPTCSCGVVGAGAGPLASLAKGHTSSSSSSKSKHPGPTSATTSRSNSISSVYSSSSPGNVPPVVKHDLQRISAARPFLASSSADGMGSGERGGAVVDSEAAAVAAAVAAAAAAAGGGGGEAGSPGSTNNLKTKIRRTPPIPAPRSKKGSAEEESSGEDDDDDEDEDYGDDKEEEEEEDEEEGESEDDEVQSQVQSVQSAIPPSNSNSALSSSTGAGAVGEAYLLISKAQKALAAFQLAAEEAVVVDMTMARRHEEQVKLALVVADREHTLQQRQHALEEEERLRLREKEIEAQETRQSERVTTEKLLRAAIVRQQALLQEKKLREAEEKAAAAKAAAEAAVARTEAATAAAAAAAAGAVGVIARAGARVGGSRGTSKATSAQNSVGGASEDGDEDEDDESEEEEEEDDDEEEIEEASVVGAGESKLSSPSRSDPPHPTITTPQNASSSTVGGLFSWLNPWSGSKSKTSTPAVPAPRPRPSRQPDVIVDMEHLASLGSLEAQKLYLTQLLQPAVEYYDPVLPADPSHNGFESGGIVEKVNKTQDVMQVLNVMSIEDLCLLADSPPTLEAIVAEALKVVESEVLAAADAAAQELLERQGFGGMSSGLCGGQGGLTPGGTGGTGPPPTPGQGQWAGKGRGQNGLWTGGPALAHPSAGPSLAASPSNSRQSTPPKMRPVPGAVVPAGPTARSSVGPAAQTTGKGGVTPDAVVKPSITGGNLMAPIRTSPAPSPVVATAKATVARSAAVAAMAAPAPTPTPSSPPDSHDPRSGSPIPMAQSSDSTPLSPVIINRDQLLTLPLSEQQEVISHLLAPKIAYIVSEGKRPEALTVAILEKIAEMDQVDQLMMLEAPEMLSLVVGEALKDADTKGCVVM